MALVTVMSLDGGAFVVEFDVDTTDTVVRVIVTNSSSASYAALVARPSGKVVEATIPPGVSTVNIPKPRQFNYSTLELPDWSVKVSR